MKFIVSHVIPDVPQWVQDEMARQQYKAQLALRVSSFFGYSETFYFSKLMLFTLVFFSLQSQGDDLEGRRSAWKETTL